MPMGKNTVRNAVIVLFLALGFVMQPSLVSADIFSPSGNSSGGIFSGIRDTIEGIFQGFQGVLPGGASISTEGTEITIRASGSYANGDWTKMQLWVEYPTSIGNVEKRLINTWSVSQTTFANYSAFLSEKNITGDRVDVYFINDSTNANVTPAEDRNLIVDYVIIGNHKIETETQPPVVKRQVPTNPTCTNNYDPSHQLSCNGCFNYGGGQCVLPDQLPVVPQVPVPHDAKQVKLTLEWDALSLGGEGAKVSIPDPLETEHTPWIACPQCGETEITPNYSVNNNYSQDLALADSAGQVLSTAPPGNDNPPPNPAPPGPEQPPNPNPAVPPTIWQACLNQTGCRVASVEHILAGWCGKDPEILNPSRMLSTIPIDSPGPNIFSLPGSISNKYIRRDGYVYSCIKDCGPNTQCETKNYVEFQTLVYPSNAFSLYLTVQNMGELPVDNVLVNLHTLTFDSSGETVFPHNIDYPIPVDNLATIEYRHGNLLTNDDMQKIGSLGNVPVSVTNGTSDDGRDITQLVLGPFDLAGLEVKKIPLQPAGSEFTQIPGTSNPYNPGNVGIVNPVKPCECQAVRLHDILGSGTCSETITNPTYDQCRAYYGISVDDGSHAGGSVCDNGGITVNGCPAPWCFVGAQSTSGPMSACPDLDGDGRGDKIPAPPAGWLLNSNTTPKSEPSLLDKVLSFIPGMFSESSLVEPPTAKAYGCQNPCKNNPPASMLGAGGIMPRDYNFVCDANDSQEAGRCAGTDDKVIVDTTSPYFETYRDVTGLGGCGYQASSNNSIIGPLQITAEYGGQGDNRTSRSVLLGSIPVGGRLSDDQGKPYGWPTTGTISQDHGYTGEADAQGYYRSDPTQDYGEYRYCSASSTSTPGNNGNGVPSNPGGAPDDSMLDNVNFAGIYGTLCQGKGSLGLLGKTDLTSHTRGNTNPSDYTNYSDYRDYTSSELCSAEGAMNLARYWASWTDQHNGGKDVINTLFPEYSGNRGLISDIINATRTANQNGESWAVIIDVSSPDEIHQVIKDYVTKDNPHVGIILDLEYVDAGIKPLPLTFLNEYAEAYFAKREQVGLADGNSLGVFSVWYFLDGDVTVDVALASKWTNSNGDLVGIFPILSDGIGTAQGKKVAYNQMMGKFRADYGGVMSFVWRWGYENPCDSSNDTSSYPPGPFDCAKLEDFMSPDMLFWTQQ